MHSGADYILSSPTSSLESDGQLDYEDTIRLEVSGIDSCSERELRMRVMSKVKQARRADHSPALAGVVAFSLRRVQFDEVK